MNAITSVEMMTAHADMPASDLAIDQLIQICSRLQDENQLVQAISLYQGWIATHPAHAFKGVAMFNLGSLLQMAGQEPAAEQTYREVLKIKPDLGQARINLGLIQERRGELDAALREWTAIVTKDAPSHCKDTKIQVTALNHIGRVLESQKELSLAENILAQSLSLDPKQPGVIQHWVHIRQKACKWPVYTPLPNISLNQMMLSTSPLAMLALKDDPAQQLLTARAFIDRTYKFTEEHLWNGQVYQHTKTRLGFYSGDLCVHAVGLLLADLLESIDRERFELYAYDASPEDGTAHRARLKKAFDHLLPVHGMTDRQIAESILHDEIDVLIDLHGLSSGSRPGIFALHPAPLQGTYLGFIGTTGMPWFDFVIADREVLPPELETYFTEKPLYLDQCFIPRTQNTEAVPTLSRADVGLPDDRFVMAAFGNSYKITPEMFETWMNILKKIDDSILWLIDENPDTTHNLKAHVIRHGVDLKRVHFTPRTSHQEFKARLKLADLFLDTYPYNCGSTTNDVINANLPMVTLKGKTMVSRMGASILKHIGQTKNIVNSYAAYIERVLQIKSEAASPPPISRIKVCQHGGFEDALNVGSVLHALYEQHQGRCQIEIETSTQEVFQNFPGVESVNSIEHRPTGPYTYDMVIHNGSNLLLNGPRHWQLFSSVSEKIHALKKICEVTKSSHILIHMPRGCEEYPVQSAVCWSAIINILLSHTSHEIVQVANDAAFSFSHHPRLRKITADFSLHEWKAMIEQAALFISTDRRLLCIANSTSTPVIGLDDQFKLLHF